MASDFYFFGALPAGTSLLAAVFIARARECSLLRGQCGTSLKWEENYECAVIERSNYYHYYYFGALPAGTSPRGGAAFFPGVRTATCMDVFIARGRECSLPRGQCGTSLKWKENYECTVIERSNYYHYYFLALYPLAHHPEGCVLFPGVRTAT